MSLTQYLKSQEDQDMTKLLCFRRREGGGLCFRMEEMGGLHSSGGESMNGMSFDEG